MQGQGNNGTRGRRQGAGEYEKCAACAYSLIEGSDEPGAPPGLMPIPPADPASVRTSESIFNFGSSVSATATDIFTSPQPRLTLLAGITYGFATGAPAP